MLAPLLCCQHCISYLCWTLQLSRSPLWKLHFLSTSKASNRKAVSLGYCTESGPLCWVCTVCNTRLGTGDWEFFFVLFRLLNPTSSGKEPATDIIRWILKRTKAPLQFFTLPVDRKKPNRNKTHPAQIPSMCVHVCMYMFIAPCPWYFNQIHCFQKIFFSDNLIFSSIACYLFSRVTKKKKKIGRDIRSAKVKTKTESKETKVYLFWLTVSNHIHNINVFLRPQGHIADTFEKINQAGEWKSLQMTVNKCIIVLPGICWWTSSVGEKKYCLSKIKAFPKGNRGREKTAGRRRVMGDRPKAWPPGVNRWLVTFIIPTQAAKWEARQLPSEELSHISMSKSKSKQGLLLATRCHVFMTKTNVGIPKWKNMPCWHTAAANRYIIVMI